MVREKRLELSHLAAPDPKSGVSTNSTTPAIETANISIPIDIQTKIKKIILRFLVHLKI